MPTDIHRLQRALGDRYVVEREIGRGGWAVVYLARDLKHDRPVAVKAFRPELALSLGTERFLREIRLAAGFQHPHILPLYDSGGADGLLYYVMPYVEGETLRERLVRDGALPVEEAVRVALDVAGALDHAHAHGVLHRDVKPENILLSGGHALVADFGIARAVSAARDERLSQPGVTVGSPAYMSPEHSLGGDCDARSDVYSLGCVTYEMLAGRPPFAGASAVEAAERYLGGGPTPLRPARADVSPALDEAVRRAVALRPADRFASAREFAAALAPALLTPASGSVAVVPAPGRRAWRLGVLAGAAVLAAGAALWRARGAEADGPVASPSVVAVFPFATSGSPASAYLRTGMVDLLSAGLDGAGDLRAADAHAVLGSLSSLGIDSAGGGARPSLLPDAAARAAARLGAGLYVLGSIAESGGRLRATASLYGPSGALAHAAAEGDTARLFEVVDRLAADLVTARGGEPAQRLTRLAARTTTSLPALKAYLQGEELLREGRTSPAFEAFTRATREDSSFALAHYRRAVAADWNANFDVARDAGEQALRYAARLSPGMGNMLRAFLAWHAGDAATAERLYRAELADHPDDVEAWYQLGEVLYHSGPLRGRSFAASRPAFERALSYDPQYSDAAFHLLDADALEGKRAAFDSLLATVRAPSSLLLRRRAVRAFDGGTDAERAMILAELANESDGTVIVAATSVAAYLRDFAGAGTIARLLTATTRPAETRGYGHLLLAQLALGRGRRREAHSELAAAGTLLPAAALEADALAASLPWVPVDAASLAGLRGALEAWNPTAVPRAASPSPSFHAHDDVHPALRRYLLALLSARMGDGRRALAEARALDSARLSPHAGSLAGDLSSGIRARLAADAGRPDEAFAALDGMRLIVPLDRVANSEFFSHAAERFLRAELLHAAGRDAEAASYYATLGEGRTDLAYLAPAQLRLGEIAEHRGEIAAAVAAYGRVLALWNGCDPEFTPALERARDGIARLGRGQ